MATPRTKWKGQIIVTRGHLGDPVAQSIEYEFVCPGDASSFDIAEDELRRLWQNDNWRVQTGTGYDPKDTSLHSYPNLEPIGPA